MPRVISKTDAEAIEQIFRSRLTQPVSVVVFTSPGKGRDDSQAVSLVEEVASLTDKVGVEVSELGEQRSAELGVHKSPSVVIVASNGGRLYYTGIPGGRQFGAFIEDLVDASRGLTEMADDVRSTIRSIDNEVDIRVFVTSFCPFSPLVVRYAHRFAIENQLVRAEMIETTEFPEVAEIHGVLGVPTTIIGASVRLEGAPAEAVLARKVLEVSRSTPRLKNS